MNLSITQVPIWLSTIFSVVFFLVPPILIANAAKKAIIRAKQSYAITIKRNILIFYWVYFILISIISLTGFFSVNTLPPRIIIVTVLPLFLFYIFIIQKKEWFRVVMNHIKLEELVFIHIFRFVGIFFFLVAYYGSLPKVFANIGGIGDILSAILVFPVIYTLKKKIRGAKNFVLVWNIIGLVDILSVLSTAIYLTQTAISNNNEGVLDFGSFPFSWIPAFAPATIIFLHILVFKKLSKN
ncbi:hypothetical protein [Tenacibaculum sp. M341]|uniref:hypothetical protein n=1 Tax=Tenacibaculum sp. M341 TaxID=2530339 RepID=UPI001052B622|nr:hypothetical protein [Tenacibaculum sp. M341]TCI91387.1 hypothetical protein EYW44_10545 [Tenacibaculum sp. M341]